MKCMMIGSPSAVGESWRDAVAPWKRPVLAEPTRLLRAALYYVDAFATRAFEGNPAAVCLPDEERDDGWMQRVANEVNLSETAFVVPAAHGYDLRWFTPEAEAPLCGHATLASAHVLWETGRVAERDDIRFHTRAGVLTARRTDGSISVDLPARPVEARDVPPDVARALGRVPIASSGTPEKASGDADLLLEFESEAVVRQLQPDFGLLRTVPSPVIATAPAAGGRHDFVSRYFAPWWGIDEDPVTGAAHCALVPYWAERLGKSELLGHQVSARSGVVGATLAGNRVILSGGAVTVSQGILVV